MQSLTTTIIVHGSRPFSQKAEGGGDQVNLRPYQRAAIDGLYAWFREHPKGNPLLVLPTGSGKSVLVATLVQEALQQWPGTRILMLTHVKELIAQNAAKLKTLWPQAPLGIYSAGLRRKDTFEPVIFAGIQSAANKAMQLGRFDLVIVDECHLIGHQAQGRYRQFLDAAREINPALRVIGLTATPFRTGHGSLMHGDEAMFSDVAYEVKMLELVEQGYLSPLISKRMATQLDVSGVGTRQGEYIQGQLQRAVDRDDVTAAALDEVLQYGAYRRRWLVFCTGVAHAEHVAEALQARGIAAGCVTGKTKPVVRDRLIHQFRAGQLRALTNADVLTTGFDAPETDLLVMLRPTQSPGLYVQIAGRGMRIAPGKENCLVLDFAGNTLRHGPVDQVQAWIPRPKDGPSEAPSKTCPECQTITATAVRVCPTCGYQFPWDESPRHDASASTAPMMSTEAGDLIEEHTITRCAYHRHQSIGKLPTLRVDYYSGFHRVASEWVCLEHQGYARAKAAAWWARRAPGVPVPQTVVEAIEQHVLDDLLLIPASIRINTRPKYPEIVGYGWTEDYPEPAAENRMDRNAA